MITPINLTLTDSYNNWVNQVDDRISMMTGIMSAYVYYASNTPRPVSQAEFTRYRLTDLCRENRPGWAKEVWREIVIDMISTLWACELIDELRLND